jgi:hypothetical protein
MSEPVDLVVNCFERTYRRVLAPGFFAGVEADNARRFDRRTAVINNVDDRPGAEGRARCLVEAGELDAFFFVADHLDEALTRAGLTRADLEPIPYFSDFALVAVTLPGPDLVLVWDADTYLREPADWVTPAIELMRRDPRVLVANPNWEVPNLRQFTFAHDGPFALGHGFSDQVFLVRRSELGRPIYNQRCVARWRYPLAHLGHIFEARLDAHLRHAGRLRATYRDAVYVHGEPMGGSYPPMTLRERLRGARNRAVVAVLRALPWRPRHLRQL